MKLLSEDTATNAIISPIDGGDCVIPYKLLKDKFYAGIDPTMKESYISDAEFSKVFSVSRKEFENLSKWRRDAKKKEVGLF